MIESKSGKYATVALMCILGGLIAIRSPERKRVVLLPVAAGLVAWAGYIGLRTRTSAASAGGSLVGDAAEFVVHVQEHRISFDSWAATRGLTLPTEAEDMAEWIWTHREAIGAEWPRIVRPLVAAFGQWLRAGHPELAWSVHGQDVVLQVHRRPWTRRRIAVEVHDIVFTEL